MCAFSHNKDVLGQFAVNNKGCYALRIGGIT